MKVTVYYDNEINSLLVISDGGNRLVDSMHLKDITFYDACLCGEEIEIDNGREAGTTNIVTLSGFSILFPLEEHGSFYIIGTEYPIYSAAYCFIHKRHIII